MSRARAEQARELAPSLIGVAFGVCLLVTGSIGWGLAAVVCFGVPLAVIGLCELVVFLAGAPHRLRMRRMRRQLQRTGAQTRVLEARLALAEARVGAAERRARDA